LPHTHAQLVQRRWQKYKGINRPIPMGYVLNGGLGEAREDDCASALFADYLILPGTAFAKI